MQIALVFSKSCWAVFCWNLVATMFWNGGHTRSEMKQMLMTHRSNLEMRLQRPATRFPKDGASKYKRTGGQNVLQIRPRLGCPAAKITLLCSSAPQCLISGFGVSVSMESDAQVSRESEAQVPAPGYRYRCRWGGNSPESLTIEKQLKTGPSEYGPTFLVLQVAPWIGLWSPRVPKYRLGQSKAGDRGRSQ